MKNRIQKYRVAIFISLLFIFDTKPLLAEDFGTTIYAACSNPNGARRLFLEGYVRGYANSFRYQLRDLGFKTDEVPNIDRICGFYKEHYDPSKYKTPLFLNVIIENEVLLVNGSDYRAPRKTSVMQFWVKFSHVIVCGADWDEKA